MKAIKKSILQAIKKSILQAIKKSIMAAIFVGFYEFSNA